MLKKLGSKSKSYLFSWIQFYWTLLNVNTGNKLQLNSHHPILCSYLIFPPSYCMSRYGTSWYRLISSHYAWICACVLYVSLQYIPRTVCDLTPLHLTPTPVFAW